MNCPYCHKPAEWVENKEVYGRNYGKSVMIWLCRPCWAYVGCHENTKRPKGSMANKEMRDWRVKAHAKFDPLWKTGTMHRAKAYSLLKNRFGKDIHIGESDVETCKSIINFIDEFSPSTTTEGG